MSRVIIEAIASRFVTIVGGPTKNFDVIVSVVYRIQTDRETDKQSMHVYHRKESSRPIRK